MSYRTINNPFDKSLSQDETISTRDSCDIETSSIRTDFFDLELQNLHSKIKNFRIWFYWDILDQLLIDDQVDKTDTK
jgi:hypothetical protein